MKIEQVTYLSSTTAVTGGITAGMATNELAVFLGIIFGGVGTLCAIGTFIVTWYYKHKNSKLSAKAAKDGIKLKEL